MACFVSSSEASFHRNRDVKCTIFFGAYVYNRSIIDRPRLQARMIHPGQAQLHKMVSLFSLSWMKLFAFLRKLLRVKAPCSMRVLVSLCAAPLPLIGVQ